MLDYGRVHNFEIWICSLQKLNADLGPRVQLLHGFCVDDASAAQEVAKVAASLSHYQLEQFQVILRVLEIQVMRSSDCESCFRTEELGNF